MALPYEYISDKTKNNNNKKLVMSFPTLNKMPFPLLFRIVSDNKK